MGLTLERITFYNYFFLETRAPTEPAQREEEISRSHSRKSSKSRNNEREEEEVQHQQHRKQQVEEDAMNKHPHRFKPTSSTTKSTSSGVNEIWPRKQQRQQPRTASTDEKLIEKFKPEESIHYEYEQVIEQPAEKKHQQQQPQTTSTTKVVMAKEKFERLGEEAAATKQQAPTSTPRSHEFSYRQMRHQLRPAVALKPAVDWRSADLLAAAYKLNPNAEEFTPRGFGAGGGGALSQPSNAPTVANAAGKIDSSVSNDNLMEFYQLQPTSAYLEKVGKVHFFRFSLSIPLLLRILDRYYQNKKNLLLFFLLLKNKKKIHKTYNEPN